MNSPDPSTNDTDRSQTIEMTDNGLVLPDELVGATGQIAVEWPSEKLQKQILSISEPGLPKVCDYICCGVLPPETAANGVPGGHLRIRGKLYELNDVRNSEPELTNIEDTNE